MTDLSKTIAPKSDQLNADDMVGGPLDVTITDVRGNQGQADQPISIDWEGGKGRPYKPCKSMRRVLVAAWGPDGRTYKGRQLRLYCDPNVKFGGIAVGGIRISHMSDIDEVTPVLLTTSRSKRSNFVVRPMSDAPNLRRAETGGDQSQPPADDELSDDDKERLAIEALSTAGGGTDTYKGWFGARSKAERLHLTRTTQKDADDFDKEKPLHDICKAKAAKADADTSGDEGDEPEY